MDKEREPLNGLEAAKRDAGQPYQLKPRGPYNTCPKCQGGLEQGQNYAAAVCYPCKKVFTYRELSEK